ncbi:hypothetical protein JTE90_021412 [Oedothorax gibbosus]|uniref:Ubiquitin carboxyl-terminal hydrolase n=1 Tax=Oedothorax gibbosus TaxID=931172 RepID=A0AAV6VH37_9ARAC|nr:hypothetical protein JTE90_021412 [Oedothorax gibbosus]
MTYWIYISAAAVVAIAGTYILWGPSNRPKRKNKNTIPGLQNLGNSCFLNAVLQSLSSCSACIGWLVKAIEYANESQSEKCMLIKAILTVLSALNGCDDHFSGGEVIKALRSHRWIISHEEHDAHELFHVLTTTVEEELLTLNPVLSLLDTKKLEKEKNEVTNISTKPINPPLKTLPMKLAFPMRGLLVNELKCNSCNYKYPVKYDTFDSISLVIPSPNSGKLTLHDLLLKFISCENIQDAVCDVCPKNEPNSDNEEEVAPVKTTFSQQVSFGKLPDCLCIHIQRTVWLKNGFSVKCYDHVSFPDVLIMDHFVHKHIQRDRQLGASQSRLGLTGGNSSKVEMLANSNLQHPVLEHPPQLSSEISDSLQKALPLSLNNEEYLHSYKHIYLLKAVIVHLGDASSGHFITYRRVSTSEQNERWFYASDLDVKEVSPSEVFRASPYMLFYEKVKREC